MFSREFPRCHDFPRFQHMKYHRTSSAATHSPLLPSSPLASTWLCGCTRRCPTGAIYPPPLTTNAVAAAAAFFSCFVLRQDGKEQLRKSCDYCAQMKRACDGGEPCALCRRRGKICERSVRRKSGPAKGAKYAPRRSKEQRIVTKVEKDVTAAIVAVATAGAGKTKADRGREQAPKKRLGGRLGSHRVGSASGSGDSGSRVSGSRSSGRGARGSRGGDSGGGGGMSSDKDVGGSGGGGGGRESGVSGESIIIHISNGGSRSSSDTSMGSRVEGAAEEQAKEEEQERKQGHAFSGRPSLPPPASAPPPLCPAPPTRDGHQPQHSKTRSRNGRRRTYPPASALPSTTTISTTMNKNKTSPPRAPYSTTTAAATSSQAPPQRRGGSPFSSSSSAAVGAVGCGGRGARSGDSRGGGTGAGTKRALEESKPPALLARQLDVNVSVSVGLSVSVDVSHAGREGEGSRYEQASTSNVSGGGTSNSGGKGGGSTIGGSSSSSSKKVGKNIGSGSDAGGGGGCDSVRVHLASSPSHGPPRKRRFPSAGAPTPRVKQAAPFRSDGGGGSSSGGASRPADDTRGGSGDGGGVGGVGDVDQNAGGGERRSSDVVSSSSSSPPFSSRTSSPSLSSSSASSTEPAAPPLKVEREEQEQGEAVKVSCEEAGEAHSRVHFKQEGRYGVSEESTQGNKRCRVHHQKRETKDEAKEEGEEKEKAREQYQVVFHHADGWRSDDRAGAASAAAAVTTLRGRISARVASEVGSGSSVTAESPTVAAVVAAQKATESKPNRTPYNAARAVVQTGTGWGGGESDNMARAKEPTRSGWGKGEGGGNGGELRRRWGAMGTDGDSSSAGGRRRGSGRPLGEEEAGREEFGPRVQAWEPAVGSGGIGPHYRSQGAPGHQGWGKQSVRFAGSVTGPGWYTAAPARFRVLIFSR